MEKVLITGGAGFIGSNLSKKLLLDGYKVTIFDNISTGRMSNLESIKDEVNFIEGDVLDKEKLEIAIKENDIIFHLAAAVGVKHIINKPRLSIETNVMGTHNVLDLCKKYDKKIIIASSSEVYGKNQEILKEDSDRILGSTIYTRWNYSCTKALDEFLALAYFKEFKLKVIIVRFFNTIGVGQVGSYGMVVPTFVSQALKNEPITIYGTGEQRRCFCDVENVVNGLLLLLKSEKYGEIFNLGTDEEIDLRGLANKIKEISNSESEIKFIPYEEAYGKNFEDIIRRRPDITKIRNLGYEPQIKLDESLKKIIESLK